MAKQLTSANKHSAAAAIMPANFLQLPPELRVHIYRHVLLTRSPIGLTHKPFQDAEAPTRGILLLNKLIHSEASAVFYGQNEFEITNCPTARAGCPVYTHDQADAFFSRLGRNTSLIRRVNLLFPSLLVTEEGNNFYLMAEDIGILRLIQRHCANLRVLKYNFPGSMLKFIGSCRDRWDLCPTFALPFDGCCRRALAVVHAHLMQALPSPLEVIINVGGELDAFSQGLMEGYGWTVSKGSPPEHWHCPYDGDNAQSIVPMWRPVAMDSTDDYFSVMWDVVMRSS